MYQVLLFKSRRHLCKGSIERVILIANEPAERRRSAGEAAENSAM